MKFILKKTLVSQPTSRQPKNDLRLWKKNKYLASDSFKGKCLV